MKTTKPAPDEAHRRGLYRAILLRENQLKTLEQQIKTYKKNSLRTNCPEAAKIFRHSIRRRIAKKAQLETEITQLRREWVQAGYPQPINRMWAL